MEHKFSGLGVAMVTPFRENKAIDYAALQRLVEHLVTNEVDYLVVLGTTGESPSIKSNERKQLVEQVIEFARDRVPVILGVGGNNTDAVIEDLESYDLSAIAGILSVSPYYNKPTQEGIYQHYKALAQASLLPIILYNVPGRTGSNISADTTLRLARDLENIVAIKEASGDLDQIGAILKERPKDFAVISGDDALTLPSMALGAHGVISVVGNAFPMQFSNMVHALLNGDLERARVIHFQLSELITQLFAEGNPGGIKEVLFDLGICDRYMRLPLVNVSETTRKRIYAAMADAELVKL